MQKTEGLIAAPYSPLDQKGRFNVDLIPAYGDYLKRSGVCGVFVNGTTGEGGTLSTEERMIAAAAWVQRKEAGFKVIIHVGYTSRSISQELTGHAGKIGADGVGMVPPNSCATESISDLISYNSEVASASPELPYYYYHFPSVSGVNPLMIDFLEEAEGRIPNLAGIKFTHDDLMDMKLCLEYADQRYDILHGRDEILIAGLSLGVKGAIGST